MKLHEICILCLSVVLFGILNLVNPDFIIIMYYLELTPNSNEMIECKITDFAIGLKRYSISVAKMTMSSANICRIFFFFLTCLLLRHH
jgi:hypothetical protein